MVVSHGSAGFIQAYNSMLGKVRQSFSLAINEVHTAPLHERYVKIRSLNYALYFLPEDLQTQFKLQIDDLTKLIADEDEAHRQNLEALFTNVDEDAHAIKEVGMLAERFKKQNLSKHFETLHEQSLEKLRVYKTNVQSSLDKQDIQSAVHAAKKIVEYKESVGAHIPEVTNIYNSICILIMKGFLSCCEILANISTTEQTQSVEKEFNDILVYLRFSDTLDNKAEEFFP
ncbi:unnamed protein product [Didymodactylos carnosus]|uniref:Uncharacterized protein n=1 Tax=Didymodactylos carnosus TaxID=1234261 RepID=A0A814EWL9_9BILA|nr:unnamed protein product [Didymodactylos carnosus]CAF1202094.1 unnamed protein product [Didymodactylos carnosus]CAF3749710.1 unnamed protein product [Didymodactylos carnosus]CAF4011863.1 unnamed protein product [Didymodactylos carnosus]